MYCCNIIDSNNNFKKNASCKHLFKTVNFVLRLLFNFTQKMWLELGIARFLLTFPITALVMNSSVDEKKRF